MNHTTISQTQEDAEKTHKFAEEVYFRLMQTNPRTSAIALTQIPITTPQIQKDAASLAKATMETATEEACKMIVNFRKARAIYYKEKAICIKLATEAKKAAEVKATAAGLAEKAAAWAVLLDKARESRAVAGRAAEETLTIATLTRTTVAAAEAAAAWAALLNKARDEAAAKQKEAFEEIKKAHGAWMTANPAPSIREAAHAAAAAKLTEEKDEEDVAIAMVEMKATAEHCVSCSVLPPKKRTRSSPITN
jgi:hypothetical protein